MQDKTVGDMIQHDFMGPNRHANRIICQHTQPRSLRHKLPTKWTASDDLHVDCLKFISERGKFRRKGESLKKLATRCFPTPERPETAPEPPWDIIPRSYRVREMPTDEMGWEAASPHSDDTPRKQERLPLQGPTRRPAIARTIYHLISLRSAHKIGGVG